MALESKKQIKENLKYITDHREKDFFSIKHIFISYSEIERKNTANGIFNVDKIKDKKIKEILKKELFD
ncbi:MAG: hypothetical protein GF317_13975 [Candidatus Lokiarchaeota archaeon]|nr:hypothetical protein [Candidatus Lokiarchaeota archaeon]MBD3200724.1 hypothetical protein [Candidatus Lokiarchaeota archaeon]